jgi:PEP-CTERM motif
VTLSYLFVDTANGLPVAGPAVASVMYEANYNPYNPTDWVTLGTSTDAATNFSLSFTVQPYEPEIQAIPYDSSGNPIVISGVDGDNVALGLVTLLNPVPEPSTLVLGIVGSLGGLGFVWFGRRKHRGRVPSVLP